MASNPENSLGEQSSLVGRTDRSDSDTHDKSLSDDVTFAQEQAKVDQANSFKDVVELADRYQLERTLGQGGMGRVDLAIDLRLGRKVAIKRIRESTVANSTSIERFLSEAKAIAALSHPNIVQIYDFGWTKDGPYIIMEYVDGGNLQEATQRGAIPLEQAIDVICRLCDGLEKAHDSGIVHRDIKPANILLTKDGIPKLTDFGLAKSELADAGVTMAGVVLGTLDFMPPEQRRDASLVDARSDLWSLAATMYQVATGKSPKVIRLHELNKSLQLILSKALEELKEDRYQTAKEFRQALGNCLHATSATIELDEGTCPQCGTPNPSHRRFCRECGGSLEATCFSCSGKIAVWEKICDHCGANQRSLLEQQSNTKTELQRHAEQLLGEFDYEAAESVAKKLADISDPRLRSFQQFGEQFLLRIAQQQEQDLARVAECMKKSQQFSQAHDYRFAIEAIEQIPENLRRNRVSGFSESPNEGLAHLRSILRKIADHETRISKLVQEERFDGLLSQVVSVLELQPHRKDMLELRDKLVDRDRKLKSARDHALTKAQEHLLEQDYEECLDELSRIDQSLIDNKARELSDQATSLLDRFSKLKQEIVYGVHTQPSEVLMKKIEQCLQIKRNDVYLLELRKALIERRQELESTRNAAVESAKERLAKQDYVGCMSLLDQIDESVRDENVKSLYQSASEAKKRRDELDQLIAQAVSSNDDVHLLALLDEYLALGPDEERQLLRMQSEVRRAEQIAMIEKTINRVNELKDRADYSTAVFELQSIPITLRTEEIESLGKQLLEYDTARQTAFEAIRTAIKSQDCRLSPELEPARFYWELLTKIPSIRDGEFMQLTAEFQETALHQRPNTNAIAYRPSLAIYFVIVMMCFFSPILMRAFLSVWEPQDKRQATDNLGANQYTQSDVIQGRVDGTQVESLGNRSEGRASGRSDVSIGLFPKGESNLGSPLGQNSKDLTQSPLSDKQLRNSIGMLFQLIPAGTFTQGEGDDARQFTITQPFYLGVCEVTQKDWSKFNWNPSRTKGVEHPVDSVSWDEALVFCENLSALREEKVAGRVYCLPTEVEWEYACRAGATTIYSFGDNVSELGQYAWFKDNSGKTTHPVGQKKPNAWGLYDMHGNVWEWCMDRHSGSQGVALPFPSSIRRVSRGGGWDNEAFHCSASYRQGFDPTTRSPLSGFRVVMRITEVSN